MPQRRQINQCRWGHMGAKHTPHWALDVFEQNAQTMRIGGNGAATATMRIGGNGAVQSHMIVAVKNKGYTHDIAAI